MRSYALLLPAFWTGNTGKAITAAGKDARIVATYLLTCEHANMLGLYRLPLLYAAEETGLKRREVAAALEQLKAFGFAHYDDATEFIWVLEMARFQLGLLPSETLKEGDKRAKGAARIYKQISTNPFLGPFHDRYSQVLGLPLRRDFTSETKPHVSPFVGAYEPLARGYDPDLDLVRKGETGETKNSPPSPTGLTPEQIQKRWNVIPGVKACKEIGKTIRERILTRITEHSQIDWWDNLLQRVQASDFLCGRTNGGQGPFHASLTWVLAPKNLDKLLAGDYDPMEIGTAPSIPEHCQDRQSNGRHSKPCPNPCVIGEAYCSDHLPVRQRIAAHLANGNAS